MTVKEFFYSLASVFLIIVLLALLISGCSGAADVSAPTPKPTQAAKLDNYEIRSRFEPTPEIPPPASFSNIKPYVAPKSADVGEIVYITRTGTKYHNAGCQYLRESCIEIELSDAIERNYDPCSRCW